MNEDKLNENETEDEAKSYEEIISRAAENVPDDEQASVKKSDEALRQISSDVKRGRFDFLNVSIIGLFILVLGITFALLRNTDEAEQSEVNPSVMGFLDGSYAKYLSQSYENSLPGKSLLADINSFFASVYGASSYNSHNNFLAPVDSDGNVINTLTASATTTTTTTTLYTGKTSNTTKEVDLNGIYLGPQSNLVTTTTTTTTTTEETTAEETTTEEPTTVEETTTTTTTTTTEEEEEVATTTIKIDLEDAVFTKSENGMLVCDYVIKDAFDVTSYKKIALTYAFYGEKSKFFIRPYIEQDGKNIGDNVNPTKATKEFDVSDMTGNIKIGIRLIARSNSGIAEGDVINVKLHYGLGLVSMTEG